MNTFELLLRGGVLTGRNSVQAGPDAAVETCDTTYYLVPLLHGTFVRLDQLWDWKGEPQEGSLLVGLDPKTGAVGMSWIDTFHNGRAILALKGNVSADGKLVGNGHFPVEGHPDWGWRIELAATAATVRIEMFVIPPGETAGSLGVWSELTRR